MGEHPDALYHRLQGDEHGDSLLSSLCSACGMARSEHLIDSEGNQIEETGLAMSISTRTEQHSPTHRMSVDLQNELQLRRHSLSTPQRVERKEQLETESKHATETESESKPTGPTKRCDVCLEDVPLDMFHVPPVGACAHEYCKTCLTQHYAVKTKDGDVLKVACIDPKCDRQIEEEEILSFLIDPEIRAKFIKFKRNKLLMLNPRVRFCCKPGCEGSMTGSRMQRKLQCPKCDTAVCFNCGQPWHGYFVGCNQQVDMGYAKWALNKDIQKCPKCRMVIEKVDGCNHMTCSSCRYEFCWMCRGAYTEYHFEWWNIFGCPGAMYTPKYCRCPHCFPRWMNRILIILCFLGVVVPLVFVAGFMYVFFVCLIMFCIRCEWKCPDMDIFDDLCDF